MITKINFNCANNYLKKNFTTNHTSFMGNNDSTLESKQNYEKVTYYNNGQVESRIVYNKKTKRAVKETFYYKNGEKSSQTIYNPETGIIESYNDWYESGKRMSRTCYDSKGRILEDISWYDDGSVRSCRRENGSSATYEIYY